jgi:hypothetical protein
MIPVAIFLFLVGAVLAWAFRVWILVPLCLILITFSILANAILDLGAASTAEYCLVVCIAPQFGYAFGLWARSVLRARHSQPDSSRKASVTALYRRATVNQR